RKLQRNCIALEKGLLPTVITQFLFHAVVSKSHRRLANTSHATATQESSRKGEDDWLVANC
ncbi:MAG: hypothetical protein IJN28_01815, partial [Selenomonadales bacterium]|nr:hypothetical protein [Selenomonadales bacterium]